MNYSVVFQGDIYHIPETAHVKEMPNLVNITWKTNENLNNSVAFRIGENDDSYQIEEIVINLLKGNWLMGFGLGNTVLSTAFE